MEKFVQINQNMNYFEDIASDFTGVYVYILKKKKNLNDCCCCKL